MPRLKIALFGAGRIGRLLYAGTAALTLCEMKSENKNFDFDVLKIAEYRDYTSLVKAYTKVQRKYYPEKDLLVKKIKGEQI